MEPETDLEKERYAAALKEKNFPDSFRKNETF
jgi:hypothetical protein